MQQRLSFSKPITQMFIPVHFGGRSFKLGCKACNTVYVSVTLCYSLNQLRSHIRGIYSQQRNKRRDIQLMVECTLTNKCSQIAVQPICVLADQIQRYLAPSDPCLVTRQQIAQLITEAYLWRSLAPQRLESEPCEACANLRQAHVVADLLASTALREVVEVVVCACGIDVITLLVCMHVLATVIDLIINTITWHAATKHSVLNEITKPPVGLNGSFCMAMACCPRAFASQVLLTGEE